MLQTNTSQPEQVLSLFNLFYQNGSRTLKGLCARGGKVNVWSLTLQGSQMPGNDFLAISGKWWTFVSRLPVSFFETFFLAGTTSKDPNYPKNANRNNPSLVLGENAWVKKVGGFKGFCMTSSEPEKKYKRLFCCFFQINWAKICIFRALGWPSNVSGWQAIWPKTKH